MTSSGIRLGHPAVLTAVFAAAPLLALAIWVLGLRSADPNQFTDLGLIAVIPPAAFLALGLLIVSFGAALAQERPPAPILLWHLVVLIFCLYGAALVVEGQPRTAIAWKLMGIMDVVMTTGSVDPARDAFQNWPGFFILAAFLTSAAGLESPLILAAWGHVIFSLLYLGPLWLLYRGATRDTRLAWLAIWFFYLCNWIGQDYLAPQAFGYFLYILILAVLLNWFQHRPEARLGANEPAGANGRRALDDTRPQSAGAPQAAWPGEPGRTRAGLTLMMVLFMGVLTPSHQLSPVALLAAIAALVVFRRVTARGLPLILGVLVAAYISYLTVPYLSGHISKLIQPLGDLGSNLDQNVTARLRGSAEHVFVVQLRIVASLGIWLVAAAGFLRRVIHGQRDVNFMLLAVVPFALVALQTYGGELLLRVFLFSLPFMAFFMAALFVPLPRAAMSTLAWAGLAALSGLLTVSFLVTRYGNERMDYFTPAEVEAMRYVYAVAEPRALIVAGTETLAWRFEHYNAHTYTAAERAVHDNNLELLRELMARDQFTGAYFILTRSQKAGAELFLGWEPGLWERFEKTIAASPDFRLLYANQDARVYILASQAEAASP